VFAAVGSAVGLGNLWRFPYVCYSNGGGAFLIPYFVALLTCGIPLMMLEIGLGQMMQSSAPFSWRGVGKRWEWVGWWPTWIALIIVGYYTVIMAWCWNYLYHSFSLGWGKDAQGFFYHDVLRVSEGPGDVGGLVWPLLAGLILSCIIMGLIIYRGPERISKVVLWTVPLPIILITILMVRGLTLPGAMDGLEFYLTPDFSALTRSQVWVQAYSQVFFSLSLAMGIMIVYASHKPRNSDVTGNAFIVSLADCGISFLCGLTIFSILGYMAHTTGAAVPDVVSSGIGLAFITIPTAIELLPTLSTLFGVVFFLALLTLAIDSAFSLIEVNTAAFMDKWGLTRRRATGMVSIIALAMGLLYSTNGGIYWLDIVDHFINNFGLAAAGLVEVLLIGWFFGTKRFKKFINPISDIKTGLWWDVMIKFVTPVVLGYSLIRYFIDEVEVAYGDYPLKFLLLGGWGMALLVLVAAIAVSKLKSHHHP